MNTLKENLLWLSFNTSLLILSRS